MASRLLPCVSAVRFLSSRTNCNFLTSHKLPIFYGVRRCFSSTSSVLLERKFSKKHEWVTLEGKTGTVGISKYAQDALGDVVYVQLPDVGSEFTKNEECGAVESVKAASEIYCPISGKVTEVNTSLEDNPALVNKSCYGEGWLFRLEVKSSEEYEALLSEEEYDKFLKSLD